MSPSPYRTAAHPLEARERPEHSRADRDIAPVFAALWVASAIRVGAALFHHETFGTEPTLAFLTVVLVPVLLFSSTFARHAERR